VLTSSMAESPGDRERLLREWEAKNVAYYSVLLQTWIETRMTRDKTLVTLSAGGIGLLVTLLTTVGVSRLWQVGLYVISFAGFLVTIERALDIYQKNSQQIEHDLRGESSQHLKLDAFDKVSIRAFYVGVVFAFLIAISSALTHTSKEVSVMSEYEKRSLDGISNLKPQPPLPERPPAQPPAEEAPVATPPPTTESPK
jgi:hypothetical protein